MKLGNDVDVVLEGESVRFSIPPEREFVIGRAATSDILLSSPAVSTRHATLRRRVDGVILTDSSTNGTSVDGQLVQKGVPVGLRDGSVVVLAPGKSKKVEFVLRIISRQKNDMKRAATDSGGTLRSLDASNNDIQDVDDLVDAPDDKKTPPNSNVKAKRPRDDEQDEERDKKDAASTKKGDTKKQHHADDGKDVYQSPLTCPICQGIFHRPVSVIPCLHSFCGCCFASWAERSDGTPTCPTCRVEVEGVSVHHQLMSFVDAYLAENPEAARDKTELAEMDRKLDAFLEQQKSGKQKRRALSMSGGSSSSSSFDGGGGGGGGGFFSLFSGLVGGFRVGSVSASNRCRNCEAPHADGYQCPPQNAPHVRCHYCFGLFPDRGLVLRHRCAMCPKFCCDGYFGLCRGLEQNGGEFRQVKSYPGFLGNAFPLDLVIHNRHETKILVDYVRDTLHLTPNQLWTDVLLPKFTAGQLKPRNMAVTPDCYVCGTCFGNFLREISYQYRVSITPNLPDNVKRPDCYWGSNCRTAGRNDQHASRYNHICEQTRFE